MAPAAPTPNQDNIPPPLNATLYQIEGTLDAKEREVVKRVRDFVDNEVAPIIEDYWGRDAFPHEIVPKIATLGIGGVGYQGYGAAGGSWLLNGFICMELARGDSSIATFYGVHTGLSPGSL